MKIAYNWIKNYISTEHSAEKLGEILTETGLEVEGIEKVETIKGGLEGVVIGHVLTKEKHPDADRLNVTTVDVGGPEILQIACGAPNVEVGQKVVVATVGCTLYPGQIRLYKLKNLKFVKLNQNDLCRRRVGYGTFTCWNYGVRPVCSHWNACQNLFWNYRRLFIGNRLNA